MKILVGYTSNNWCAAHTTRGFAPYSEHEVILQRLKGGLISKFFEKDSFGNYSMVYLHSSRLIKKGQEWMKHTPGWVKWGIGIRGFPAYRKYKNGWHVYDVLSVPNHKLKYLIQNHPINPVQNVHVCHQGADPDVFKPMPEYLPNEFTIIWGGNKNRASKRFPMLEKLPYKKAYAGPGLGGLGRYYEHYTELPVFYNMGHVYVQPARNDGFSACPLEAAFCGKPIVGFKGLPSRGGNGIEEYVPDEWLVQTESIRGEGEERLLIPLIDELRDNKDVYTDYSQKIREIVISRYTHELVAKEYDKMFESVMK